MDNSTGQLAGLDALVGATKQISIAIGALNKTLSTVFPTGLTTTITLAKLTGGGTNGSAGFTNGILTSYSAPT